MTWAAVVDWIKANPIPVAVFAAFIAGFTLGVIV